MIIILSLDMILVVNDISRNVLMLCVLVNIFFHVYCIARGLFRYTLYSFKFYINLR